ncbi:hypothetical protein TNCV_2867361 [Trichonephila clavipes]|nr:hypothetical protein TNCV_2867361 [Trichonephila clavipes]
MFGCCPGLHIHQYLSPIKNDWSMVAEGLARYHTADTTVDELWHRVEAAWASVPVHTIQSLFDSMLRCSKLCSIAYNAVGSHYYPDQEAHDIKIIANRNVLWNTLSSHAFPIRILLSHMEDEDLLSHFSTN